LREVGAEEPPSSVAVDLRDARLRLGIDLRQAAEELRIRFEHLDALEDGRFDDLPGPAYVFGFLRAYAKYLGLDGEEIVSRFKSETSDFGGPLKLDFPSPQEEGRAPTGALLLIALALAAAAYAGWYYITRIDDRVTINEVPKVPARLVEEATPPSAPDTVAAAASDTDASNLGATASIATNTGPSITESSVSGEASIGATEPTPAVASAGGTEPTGDAAPPVSTMAVDTAKTEPTVVSTTFATDDQASHRLQPAAETPTPISTPSLTAPTITAPLIIPPTTVAPAAAAPTTAVPFTPGPSETVASVEAVAPASPTTQATTTAATGATIVATAAPAIPVTVASSTPKRTAVVQRRQSVRPARRSSATVATTAVPAVPPPPVASADYVPRSFGQGSAGSRIEIRAEAESWVQVTGVDNELLLTRILRPGDVYHVPDQPGLVLMTGNAGGIRITVDGKAAPSLGNNGDVRRNVVLDPERLLAGTATRR